MTSWIAFGVRWGKENFSRSPVSGADAIMAALNKNLYGYSVLSSKELNGFAYTGSLKAANFDEMAKIVSRRAKEISEGGARPLVLGGDHSVSYAVVKGLAEKFGRLQLIHFDAHLDMADFDPNLEEEKGVKLRYCWSTWLRRAIEDGFVKKVLCVGIRDCSKEEINFATRAGVKIITADVANNKPALVKAEIKKLNAPYITIDADVLDPSAAPAVAVPVPGGLSVPALLDFMRAVKEPVGLDVTEVCSQVVPDDQTAMALAFLIREWVCEQE